MRLRLVLRWWLFFTVGTLLFRVSVGVGVRDGRLLWVIVVVREGEEREERLLAE